jgi:hypothetical protein
VKEREKGKESVKVSHKQHILVVQLCKSKQKLPSKKAPRTNTQQKPKKKS